MGRWLQFTRTGIVLAAAWAASAPAQAPGIVSAGGVHGLIEAYAGRVVVVNFWATWCPPCLREFPDIIQAWQDYNGQGLDVLAVSMNEADEMADIEAFLAEFAPPFPVYRANEVSPEFYAAIEPNWFGEMPMTLVFNTAGDLVHVHKKPLTYAELVADVRPLLP